MEENVQNPVVEQCVVGLRFQPIGKIYHFDASNFRSVQEGDYVVVETSRGSQLGKIVQFVSSPDRSTTAGLKSILRIATPQDLLVRQQWVHQETEALKACRAKALELRLNDVKIVSAEFSLDGNRLLFVFSSEEGEKTDLKSLKRAMQRTYPQTHVEMHLVGPRDVAKALGGMGACGLECRCCSTFLTEFSPISIKMAKEQGISLTPTEITGMCGRLRCCLVYEYEQYVEARKQLPKRGKLMLTPRGNGKVLDVNPLKGAVLIELEQGGIHEFMHDELQPLEELAALQKKADSSCENCPEETRPVDTRPEMRRGKRDLMVDQDKVPDAWESPQRILVVLAHPDDPEFFCGATTARWVRAGHHVMYCVITCGDKGTKDLTIASDDLCSIRQVEQRSAAKVLGVDEVRFLNYPDGYLVADINLRRDITRVIRAMRPDVLVTCDPQTLFTTNGGLNHPDHRAAGQATLDAVFPAARDHLNFPELWKNEHLEPHIVREVWVAGTLVPDVTLDVTETWEIKIKALFEHKSQIGEPDKLAERIRNRRTADSTAEKPRYEEKYRRLILG